MRNSLKATLGSMQKGLAAAGVMLATLSMPTAEATLLGEAPELSLHVLDSLYLLPKFSVSSQGGEITFNATLVTSVGGPNFDGDVYLGVIPPGLASAFSWSLEENAAELVRGLVPIAEDIPLNEDARISVPFPAREGITYQFGADEPLGMYIVFAILVKADADPALARNWVAVELKPLMRQ